MKTELWNGFTLVYDDCCSARAMRIVDFTGRGNETILHTILHTIIHTIGPSYRDPAEAARILKRAHKSPSPPDESRGIGEAG